IPELATTPRPRSTTGPGPISATTANGCSIALRRTPRTLPPATESQRRPKRDLDQQTTPAYRATDRDRRARTSRLKNLKQVDSYRYPVISKPRGDLGCGRSGQVAAAGGL